MARALYLTQRDPFAHSTIAIDHERSWSCLHPFRAAPALHSARRYVSSRRADPHFKRRQPRLIIGRVTPVVDGHVADGAARIYTDGEPRVALSRGYTKSVHAIINAF